MEGRMVVVEGHLEAVEVAIAETKADTGALRQETAAIRQDVQAILKALGERNPNHHGKRQGESESSVNDNGGGPKGEGGRSGDGNQGGLSQWRKRVELPVFEGGEPWVWIGRAEKFFEVQKVAEEEKLELAFISMDGYVGSWFRFWREKTKNLSWDGLKRALGIRFGVGTRGTVYERLSTIRQSGPVEEYIRDFEVLVGQTTQIPEKQIMGYFLSGLREEVGDHVWPHDPPDLMTAMRVARDVEKLCTKTGGGWLSKNQSSWGKASGSVTRVEPNRETTVRVGTAESVGSVNKDATQGRNKGVATSSGGDRNVRNLPYSEYLKRREEGRCFRCGGPFGPGHRCPERGLKMLIVVEEEEEAEGDEVKETNLAKMELSALSAGGLTTPKTMKLRGHIGHREVLVLIDSGASHNFIDRRVVEELQMTVTKTQPYMVSLGDGQKKRISGCCEGVKLELGEAQLIERFYLFELGGVEIILGVEWLQRLGEVMVDWGKLKMMYKEGGREVTVRGDPTLERKVVGPRVLMKMDRTETCYVVWELGSMEAQQNRLKNVGLTEKQKREMESLLENYDVVFSEAKTLPPNRAVEHHIQLKEGVDPVNVRPYRYPHAIKAEIEHQIAEMLRTGVIRPSHSPYSSPVILVKKKDDSWRFCIDYRALNRATVPDKFPIPVIEELLDELNGASYFSKVDLKAGYHQIRMSERDVEKTAFRTHQGHYEFVVMPFGLTNAPATFQSAMNALFQPYLRRYVLVFFDDILVYSRTWEEHLEHVKCVLTILQRDQWVANKGKCEFGQTQVKYLGHIVSSRGVEMDDEKIKAVVEWERPKTVKSLRGFLGLTGYYRRFVRDYGKIARPLTELLKKGGFSWNEKAEEAWVNLKKKMTTAPVLSLPDFTQPFHIECDASGSGVGAVLMQGRNPIAYFSKALSEGKLSKSIYEKEMMALVLAIQHWRPYLVGQRFVVHTDQKSLCHLLEQRITTQNQQDWIAKLLGYDFEIVYKTGAANKAADALSRQFEGEDEGEKELSVIARPFWQDFGEIMQEVEVDEFLQKVMNDVRRDPNTHPAYTLEHERLHHKGRLVLSAKSKWIPKLLAEFHVTQTGGHSGVYRTYRRIAQSLYWVGMKKDVTEFVAKCLVCQQHKYLTSSPQGLLQPLPVPNAIWEELSMDFIVRLPKSQGFDAILVVVDRLSKYAHFLPLKHPYSAKTVAEIFIREIVRLHGIPQSIVSDRDPLFLSIFWKELFKGQGTQLKMSTAYHPETDGQTEVLNRVLEGYLRCFCSKQPKGWMTYNTSYQGAIRYTPFEAVYGRAPPSLHRFIPGESLVEAVSQELLTRDEALKQLKFHLERAQDLMVRQANKKRKAANVEVGDWVYLKIRPHRQTSMQTRLHPKLAARYFGPFLVVQKVGENACKLQLPETVRIHPVFHVSQVKKAIGEKRVERDLPQDLQAEGPSFWPVSILGRRQLQEGGESVPQLLVEWQEGGQEGATWENEITIREQYPDFNLGDKVGVQGAGIDRDNRRWLNRIIPVRKVKLPHSFLHRDSTLEFWKLGSQSRNLTISLAGFVKIFSSLCKGLPRFKLCLKGTISEFLDGMDLLVVHGLVSFLNGTSIFGNYDSELKKALQIPRTSNCTHKEPVEGSDQSENRVIRREIHRRCDGGQTPKVAKQDKKKKPRGRAHKRMQYNRRFVTAGVLVYVVVVVGFGKKRGPNSSEKCHIARSGNWGTYVGVKVRFLLWVMSNEVWFLRCGR
ncbi:hypothetical protein V8G54_017146 [Vigna mungo]|uniref:Reverse transcriptase n=2 Tax=Magnoliopsida TaxID=3398 RepID=A0AAQ3S1U4_VIGMU